MLAHGGALFLDELAEFSPSGRATLRAARRGRAHDHCGVSA